MENQNMESVALLKSENRKLMKQLKEASASGGGGSAGGPPAANKATQREIAALSVENEQLQREVAEMKQQLEDNAGG